MDRQYSRMDMLIQRLKHGRMCAVPNDVLITVQENIRNAHRLMSMSEDLDPTAMSVARNYIRGACEAMDSYAGERR